jgi:O-methyltransferase involved in polyketide biosynthesis
MHYVMSYDASALNIDVSRPSQARVWNHLLGGADNFAVDRAAGDAYAASHPLLVSMVRTTREFLGRAVRHLAGEAGIRQFLDVGSGLPTAGNTHQIAHRAAPGARVVYADNCPDVVRFSRALLTPAPPQGAADFVEADLRAPDQVLAAAARTLDLDQPVALVLGGILGHMPTYEKACGIVERLLGALPAGSCLLAHDVTDTDPDWCTVQARRNATGPLPYHLRTPGQIAHYFAGLELVEPGVVPVRHWRPDPAGGGADPGGPLHIVGGIGRKTRLKR